MKKLTKTTIVMLLVLSLLPIQIFAATDANQAEAERISAAVLAMTRQEELAEFMNLLDEIQEPEAFINTFTGAFSFFAQDADSAEKTALLFSDVLDFYDGTNLTAENIEQELLKKVTGTETLDVALGIDEAKILSGVDKLNSVFIMLDNTVVNNLLGDSKKVFEVNADYTELSVNQTNAEKLVGTAADFLEIEVEDASDILESMDQLALYYGTLSEDERYAIFNYFNAYGFATMVGEGLILLPGGLVPPAGVEIIAAPNFTDIDDVEWAQEAIITLFQYQVIEGKSLEEFDPNGDITRAEFAALIVRLLDIEAVDPMELDDVKDADWFADDVYSVIASGYFEGKSAKVFDPYATIKREEVATVIGRIMIDKGFSPLSEASKSLVLEDLIDDGDDVSFWAEDGVALLVEFGVAVNEEGIDEMFYPTRPSSRAEVAEMLFRLTEKIETKVVR